MSNCFGIICSCSLVVQYKNKYKTNSKIKWSTAFFPLNNIDFIAIINCILFIQRERKEVLSRKQTKNKSAQTVQNCVIHASLTTIIMNTSLPHPRLSFVFQISKATANAKWIELIEFLLVRMLVNLKSRTTHYSNHFSIYTMAMQLFEMWASWIEEET